MKKILSVILCVIMLVYCTASADVTFTRPDDILLWVDGKWVKSTDSKAFVENGRTMAPVRAITEAMGADVSWNAETRTVSIEKPVETGWFTAVLQIDSQNITIRELDTDRKTIKDVTTIMDVPAKTVNGRTYIPCRFVAYAMGYEIDWNGMQSIVGFNFTGQQNTDFEVLLSSEKYPVYYTDLNGTQYPARQGYGNILIADANKAKFTDGKRENMYAYSSSSNYVVPESSKEEYKISAEQTAKQNIKNFAKLYTDIARENSNFRSDTNLSLDCSTVENTNWISYGKQSSSISHNLLDENKEYYGISCLYQSFDHTMYDEKYRIENDIIYINDDIVIDFAEFNARNEEEISEKMDIVLPVKDEAHDAPSLWKEISLLTNNSTRNALFLLNEFLGEGGQRIWTMMQDYYHHSGYQYVEPGTLWPYYSTTEVAAYWRGNLGWFPCPDTEYVPPISRETVEKYGLEMVEFVDDGNYQYVLKYNGQLIYLVQHKLDLAVNPFINFVVYFENVDNGR